MHPAAPAGPIDEAQDLRVEASQADRDAEPMRSAVRGLYMADTSHYYPEDRSISESMRIGARLAGMALSDGR